MPCKDSFGESARLRADPKLSLEATAVGKPHFNVKLS